LAVAIGLFSAKMAGSSRPGEVVLGSSALNASIYRTFRLSMAMNVTIEQKDILHQTIESLRSKYAGYRICSIAESWDESCQGSLMEHGVWHGPYDHVGVQWEFELQKVAGDYKGPDRLTLNVSPAFDVVFADIYPKVFVIEVSFTGFPEKESRPALYQVEGLAGQI
jgi:hypothetical protein